MPLVRTSLGGDIFQEICQRLVGVIDPDHRRGHGLLRSEILVDQQDTCPACVNVFLVLRVGEKTQLPRFAMLDLGERCDRCLGIAFHGSPEHLSQLLCGKFHLLYGD